MNDNDITDKLLDEIAARIRNAPVPEYPGPPLLDSLASAIPKPVRESPTSRQYPRATVVTVSCSLVALLALIVGALMRNAVDGDPHPRHHIAKDNRDGVHLPIDDLDEPRDFIVGPVQVSSIDTGPEFERMTEQLNRLAARLHMLETEVALREVQSDAATLLAEYAPRKSTIW